MATIRKLCLTVLLTAGWLSGFAQDSGQQKSDRNNALSLELGKTGIIYNLVYDHRFVHSSFGVRAGVGSNFGKYFNLVSFLAGGYYIAGKRLNFFETGTDVHYLIVSEISDDQRGLSNLIYPDYPVKTMYVALNVGYRRNGEKTLFRVGIAPGIIQKRLIPGGYVSFGIRW